MPYKRKQYYKTSEVAQMLMVSTITIRQWENKGKLKAVMTLGGHRRFLHSDIEKFARKNNLSLQFSDEGMLRVLVVDDDEQLGNYLFDLLQGLPTEIEVKVARDGFAAGGLVYSFSPHIVLLDLMMSGLDGFQVCKEIKQEHGMRNIRVIAMTGFHSEENIKKIISQGVETCLKKPFEPEQLYDAMGIDYQKIVNPVN